MNKQFPAVRRGAAENTDIYCQVSTPGAAEPLFRTFDLFASFLQILATIFCLFFVSVCTVFDPVFWYLVAVDHSIVGSRHVAFTVSLPPLVSTHM